MRIIITISLLISILLTGCATSVYAYQADLPTPRVRQLATPTLEAAPAPTATQTPSDRWYTMPTAVVGAGGKSFGWQGQIGCYDCTPFNQRIKVTHYNPQRGDINCWLWSDEFNWCMSETFSGVPWESVWGFGAACPPEWPIGTWVEIPSIGSFVCFDRGDMVLCDFEKGICQVDLLGPGGAEWDGKEFDAVLWVPLKPRR